MSIRVSAGSIERRNGARFVQCPLQYPLDQMVLMNLLAGMRGVIVHSCGASLGGRGLVFPATSGGGKTTLARLLQQHGGFRVLSDDRIIIREIGKTFRCYGTPWPGEGGMALNESAPLRALFFLTKGARNRIVPLTAAEAVERLLPVTSIPWYDVHAMSGALSLCGDVATRVPCYEFQFRPEVGAAEFVARHMKGQSRRPARAAR